MERLKRKLSKSMKQRGLLGTLKLCVKNVIHIVASKLVPENGMGFDGEYGTDTNGIIELSDLVIQHPMWEYGVRYQATPPDVMMGALRGLDVDFRDFVFIDFGSGKGRALLLASGFPFKKIIGVEISEELNEIAWKNIAKFKSDKQKCRNLESVCAHATEFPLPEENLVLYFYNPFAEIVMTELLDGIRKSLDAHPRTIYIVYYNPVAAPLLDGMTFLEKVRATRKYLVYRSVCE